MTIPTLVSKYQKHTYVVGLKKAYSVLSNAFILSRTEGILEFDNYGNITNGTKEKTIEEYMKVIEKCGRETGKQCDFLSNSFDINSYPNFITEDSMIFSTYSGGIISNGVIVDINGKKGPNTFGRDQFVFTVTPENNTTSTPGTVVPWGAKSTGSYYWNSNNIPKCTTQSVDNPTYSGWNHGASTCAGRVLEEGAMNY